jgi:hypothetical protein
MKKLGMQMIPAYSPQARGRCERNFGTWQGRLPQELRLAGISGMQEANQFLRERYIAEFNAKFSVPAKERGSAFRKTSRSDLNWIFSIQTERVVAQDNTIGFRDQIWQLEKTLTTGSTDNGSHGEGLSLQTALRARLVTFFGRHQITMVQEPGCYNRRANALHHMAPNEGGRKELRIAAQNRFIVEKCLRAFQAGRLKEARKMVRDPVVPMVGCAPIEERPVETAKFERGQRLPGISLVIVVEDHYPPSEFCRCFHPYNRRIWLADPLQGTRGRDNVEAAFER